MNQAETPTQVLLRLINGYRVSQAIAVAVMLGLPDLLRAGPRGSGELAAATHTEPDALYRLLRALASVGVLRAHPDRTFSLSEVGEGLSSEAAFPLGGVAVMQGRDWMQRTWNHLSFSVRTGRAAFPDLYGQDPWTYRSERPAERAVFDDAMTDMARTLQRSLLEAYDFSACTRLVDVGGGRGALLAAVLGAYPGVTGVLFDLDPWRVGAPAYLDAAGVRDRCELVGGSFFEQVPAGGDLYVLMRVLHDWEDPSAIRILRTCRQAMPDQARLLIIERVLDDLNSDPEAAFADLHMLVMLGGRERTRGEYASLLDASGFDLLQVLPSQSGFCVVEARARA